MRIFQNRMPGILKRNVLVAVACLAVLPQALHAWTYVLTSGNSSVTVNADSDYGMSDWTVDGVPQLFKQWFWYRAGSATAESPLNRLGLKEATLSGGSMLNTVYKDVGSFEVDVTYSLLGGMTGSGSSAITEQIQIKNLQNSPLNFHFFQYVDFDLGGSGLGDTAYLERNLQGMFEKAYQIKGNSYFADEIVSPAANHGEVSWSPSILPRLQDNSPTTLNDSVGPATGDATWAFQWDVVIPVGGSFDIAINKSVYVAPEPGTMSLLAVGGFVLAAVRRGRSLRQ